MSHASPSVHTLVAVLLAFGALACGGPGSSDTSNPDAAGGGASVDGGDGNPDGGDMLLDGGDSTSADGGDANGGSEPDGGDGIDGGPIACQRPIDCNPDHPEDRFHWICTPSHECVRLCTTDGECPTGKRCDLGGVCVTPLCASDSDCASSDTCVGGRCTSRAAIASATRCAVIPATALLAPGHSQVFAVEAFDDGGNRVPAGGSVAWTATTGLQVTSDPQDGSRAIASGTGENGQVRATLGSVTCPPAAVRAFGPPTANHLRVVVADALSFAPLIGARVVVSESTGVQEATTGDSGAAEVEVSTSAKRTISVFALGHAYLTYVDVAALDVVALLVPRASVDRWAATLTPNTFDTVPSLRGTVHFAVGGTPLPANPADFRLARTVGRVQETVLDLGSQQPNVNFVEGASLGLGSKLFKSDVSIERHPGTGRLWGLFANVDFGDFARQIGPSISSGDPADSTSMWLDVLALARDGSAGLVDRPDPTTPAIALAPQADLRLSWEFELPTAPEGFDRALVLLTAQDADTLVPFGARGVIDSDANGTFDPILPSPGGKHIVRAAPAFGGLEHHRAAALAVALRAMEPDESLDGPTGPLAPKLLRSGLRVNLGVPAATSALQPLAFHRPFPGAPPAAAISGRTFTYATAAETGLARLDVGGDLADGWSVYLPPTSTARDFTLPAPPAGWPDVLTQPRAGGAPTRVLLQSITFASGSTVDEESVATFGGTDAAAVGEATEAWSTMEVR